MKIWVDDDFINCQPPDNTYIAVQSVNGCIAEICCCEDLGIPIDLIDLDHDAGIYASCGGDYIKILDWLEATGRNYPIRLHTTNPVGRMNMRAIIQKNGWKEV